MVTFSDMVTNVTISNEQEVLFGFSWQIYILFSLKARKAEALRLKEAGNVWFKDARYECAIESYTEALVACLLCHKTDRSVIYANRAAAKIKLVSSKMFRIYLIL